jgi:glutamate dehydrogenase
MATRRLIEDVLVEQKTVVRTMMSRMTLSDQPADIIEAWADDNAGLIDPLRAMMDDMQAGGWSFAKLSIVNAVLREWAGRL